MSGIYIHIPFCKQACHYCDFHFSTSTKKREAMVAALQRELELRRNEFKNDTVETVYFGGGTPSVLTTRQIDQIVETVYKNYKVSGTPEITLEANPDDLVAGRSGNDPFVDYLKTGINRLSIGIQSFFDVDLKLMNRAHNAKEAEECLGEAQSHFDRVSIDLIYGIPGMDTRRWQQNIEKALFHGLSHISSYALTVEPKTALAHMVEKGQIGTVDDALAREHFYVLADTLEQRGFVNYEISNFGKEGHFSKNNTAYWQGKKYIGIGPSAHSFNGFRRGWNVRNNSKYIKAIQEGRLPMETEELSVTDRYNEYVMTGLRTIWGVSLKKISAEYGEPYTNYLIGQSQKYGEQKLLAFEGDILKTTKKGKFLVDGIASDLFFVD